MNIVSVYYKIEYNKHPVYLTRTCYGEFCGEGDVIGSLPEGVTPEPLSVEKGKEICAFAPDIKSPHNSKKT